MNFEVGDVGPLTSVLHVLDAGALGVMTTRSSRNLHLRHETTAPPRTARVVLVLKPLSPDPHVVVTGVLVGSVFVTGVP